MSLMQITKMKINKTEINSFLTTYKLALNQKNKVELLRTEKVINFLRNCKAPIILSELDPVEDTEVLLFIKESTNIPRVDKSGCLINQVINVYLDDRPPVMIAERNLGEFFFDYQKRCLFLESILGLNASDEINRMIDYLNNEVDDLDIYHFSLYPVKTDFKTFSLGKYSLYQLDEEEFRTFLNSHQSLASHINSIQKIINSPISNRFRKIINFPLGNRALLISKERVKRKQQNESYHLYFDRLDDIYSNHTIVKFLFDYYFGNIGFKQSSISTDNFPFAGTSSSSNFYQGELKNIEQYAIDRIQKTLTFLESKLYYRLIIRAEITSNETFARCVLLRSILDPFFEKRSNKRKIENAEITLGSATNRLSKTLVQSKLIIKSLIDNGSPKHDLVTDIELANFLKIRNKIAHPRPSASVLELHQIYEKSSLIRQMIYEFVFILIERKMDNSLDDFEIDTLL